MEDYRNCVPLLFNKVQWRLLLFNYVNGGARVLCPLRDIRISTTDDWQSVFSRCSTCCIWVAMSFTDLMTYFRRLQRKPMQASTAQLNNQLVKSSLDHLFSKTCVMTNCSWKTLSGHAAYEWARRLRHSYPDYHVSLGLILAFAYSTSTLSWVFQSNLVKVPPYRPNRTRRAKSEMSARSLQDPVVYCCIFRHVATRGPPKYVKIWIALYQNSYFTRKIWWDLFSTFVVWTSAPFQCWQFALYIDQALKMRKALSIALHNVAFQALLFCDYLLVLFAEKKFRAKSDM